MKKIWLLIFALCLTGCGNEDFTKTCKIETNSKDLNNVETIDVSFNNKDEITNVIVTKSYKSSDSEIIDDIKESASTYNNALLKKDGIKISISKDDKLEYEVKYYLDVPNMLDDDLELFDLQKNSVKYFNKMQSKDISCK